LRTARRVNTGSDRFVRLRGTVSNVLNSSKIIRRAAVRVGIKKRIGWLTFGRAYSSTLISKGENLKVVQELMRHASGRFTLEVYTHAKAMKSITLNCSVKFALHPLLQLHVPAPSCVQI
jgi:site-specific recombinase XerD